MKAAPDLGNLRFCDFEEAENGCRSLGHENLENRDCGLFSIAFLY